MTHVNNNAVTDPSALDVGWRALRLPAVLLSLRAPVRRQQRAAAGRAASPAVPQPWRSDLRARKRILSWCRTTAILRTTWMRCVRARCGSAATGPRWVGLPGGEGARPSLRYAKPRAKLDMSGRPRQKWHHILSTLYIIVSACYTEMQPLEKRIFFPENNNLVNVKILCFSDEKKKNSKNPFNWYPGGEARRMYIMVLVVLYTFTMRCVLFFFSVSTNCLWLLLYIIKREDDGLW